ncbi:hypothetical protein PIB30_017718 [Stylosanthes scabra]|uniref:Uncharacterized protein n=1 Tax=Stylosanthes scabra TaxID=79078 RepID=A0ABU6R853_9FABA|nr:hypothetical protein [Stylosanthes scabra]
MDQNDAVQVEPSEALNTAAHGHVMCQVGAGAVSGEEHAGEVGVVVEPGLRAAAVCGGVRGGPLDGFPGVVVCDGEGVFRCEAVVDGDNDGVGLGGECVEVAVVGGVEGGADAEGAAVDVDEERDFSGGVWWEVEAGGDAGLGVDGDVFGLDVGEWVGAGRGGVSAGETIDGSVFVEAEEVGEFTENLLVGVWIHGG